MRQARMAGENTRFSDGTGYRLALVCIASSCYTVERALFILLAGMLSVAGLWLLYRGVFFDLARGVPRCCRCWYPLVVVAGAAELERPADSGGAARDSVTCAECGTVHSTREQMLRTRRSKARVALACLLLGLALVAPVVPGIRASGLWPSLPEWAVYGAAKIAGRDSAAWKELEKRVLEDTRLPRGTWGVSRELITASIVRTRGVWPVETTPRIRAPRLLAPFTVNGVDSNSKAIAAYLQPEAAAWSGLPELPSHEVYWEERTLPVDRPAGVAEDAGAWQTTIFGLIGGRLSSFEVAWTFDSEISRIITPHGGPGLDEAVRAYLSPTLIRGMTTHLPAVSLIRGGVRPPELADHALGLRITIKRGETIAATGWCWHAGDAGRPNGRADKPPVLLTVLGEDSQLAVAFEALGPENLPGAEWTMTIESDLILALRDFEASKCWQGKLVWPLADALRAR